MSNIELDKMEWFILHDMLINEIELCKEYHNGIRESRLNGMLNKLINSMPTTNDAKIDITREYKCDWIK